MKELCGSKVVATTQFNQTVEDSEEIPVMLSSTTEVARIRVERGYTINLGNYESAKVHVSVELPCDVDKVENEITALSTWVEELANAEADRVSGVGSSKPSAGGRSGSAFIDDLTNLNVTL